MTEFEVLCKKVTPASRLKRNQSQTCVFSQISRAQFWLRRQLNIFHRPGDPHMSKCHLQSERVTTQFPSHILIQKMMTDSRIKATSGLYKVKIRGTYSTRISLANMSKEFAYLVVVRGPRVPFDWASPTPFAPTLSFCRDTILTWERHFVDTNFGLVQVIL